MPAATGPCKPFRLCGEVLHRAWINLDFIWAGKLVIFGDIAQGVGIWSLLTG
jgi:hypothetical protein